MSRYEQLRDAMSAAVDAYGTAPLDTPSPKRPIGGR